MVSWPCVWALKALQNSMIFTPCWPNAGPIGGDGFALPAGIWSLIKEEMPDAQIIIKDLAGDENHYSATIKSKVFSGKSKIEQHKLVYKALKGKMGNELHALTLNTMEI